MAGDQVNHLLLFVKNLNDLFGFNKNSLANSIATKIDEEIERKCGIIHDLVESLCKDDESTSIVGVEAFEFSKDVKRTGLYFNMLNKLDIVIDNLQRRKTRGFSIRTTDYLILTSLDLNKVYKNIYSDGIDERTIGRLFAYTSVSPKGPREKKAFFLLKSVYPKCKSNDGKNLFQLIKNANAETLLFSCSVGGDNSKIKKRFVSLKNAYSSSEQEQLVALLKDISIDDEKNAIILDDIGKMLRLKIDISSGEELTNVQSQVEYENHMILHKQILEFFNYTMCISDLCEENIITHENLMAVACLIIDNIANKISHDELENGNVFISNKEWRKQLLAYTHNDIGIHNGFHRYIGVV